MNQENSVSDMQDTSSKNFQYKFPFHYYQSMPVDIALCSGLRRDWINTSQKITKTTLFVSLSKFYPGMDCLIYDYLEDITEKKHKDNYYNWKEKSEKKWLTVFENCQVAFI